MATAKKSTAAVKSAAKKATSTAKPAAKKATPTKVSAKKAEVGAPAEAMTMEPGPTTDVPDISNVAKEVIEGKWNSGRERDDALRLAGHDPLLVQQEVARQQSQV
jgi:hypothetical protein